MDFQGIQRVEKADTIIDTAFGRGTMVRETQRSKVGGIGLQKTKNLELAVITAVYESIDKSLSLITTTFPIIEKLPPFYLELVRCTLSFFQVKKSLGAVHWARTRSAMMFGEYSTKMKRAAGAEKVKEFRRMYYGRAASLLKQISADLVFLEESRREFRKYPSIKEGMPTIAIAGFPNVGKSTLLARLTPSKAEIAAYPFTTTGLNVGIAVRGSRSIQIIDTPGTLNRRDAMNSVEQQAYLAMKLVSGIIVYVFDLTEPYPLAQQVALYDEIIKFEKPVVIYLSKADIITKAAIENFKRKYPSAYTDRDELANYLFSII